MLKKKIMAALTVCLLSAALPTVLAAEDSGALTLEKSIQLAMDQNEQIHAMQSSSEAAKWSLEQAKGAREPSLTYSHTAAKIGGKYWQTFHITDDPSSYFINTFAASYPVYTGGKIEGGIAAARIGAEISDLQLVNVKQQIRYAATQAYYNILACQNFEQARAQAVDQLAGHLDNVNQELQVGLVARADVLRSEVALANAQQALVTARNNTAVAKASFNKLLGRSVQEPVSIADALTYEPTSYELSECVDYALSHRADYDAAQKSIDAAKENVKIAAAGSKPSVALTGSYTTYDTKFNEFGTKQWMAGVNVSMNIFDGDITSNKVKEAKAREAQAEHSAKDEASTVEFEVQQAYLDMKKSESNIDTNKTAVSKAEEDFRLAGARYNANLGTNLDVVDAEVALTNARTNYIQSLYDYNVSKAALEKAMGRE